MNLRSQFLRAFRLLRYGIWLLSGLPLISSAQVQSGLWTSKTKAPPAQLAAYFPRPATDTGDPELLVVPLLGPERRLLPGGRLLVWVGRTDGTSLANASVTFRVPEPGNALVNNGSRTIELTLTTNADGIAEVRITAPDIPPDSAEGSNGGGGGGPVAT